MSSCLLNPWLYVTYVLGNIREGHHLAVWSKMNWAEGQCMKWYVKGRGDIQRSDMDNSDNVVICQEFSRCHTFS